LGDLRFGVGHVPGVADVVIVVHRGGEARSACLHWHGPALLPENELDFGDSNSLTSTATLSWQLGDYE